MNLSSEDAIIILILVLFSVGLHMFNKYIYPRVLYRSIKIIEKNPKWLVSGIIDKYYGFYDVDIVLGESRFNILPCIRRDKKTNRYELVISEDTVTTKDVNAVACLALNGKLNLKYGIAYADKPLFWLSILCYMLDGGEVNEDATTWKDREDKKQVD